MLLGTLKRTIASAVMATATHARRARRSKCPCRVDGGEARVLIPPVPRFILLAPLSVTTSLYSTTVSRALRQPLRSRGENELLRTPCLRTYENAPSTHLGEYAFSYPLAPVCHCWWPQRSCF